MVRYINKPTGAGAIAALPNRESCAADGFGRGEDECDGSEVLIQYELIQTFTSLSKFSIQLDMLEMNTF